MFESDHLPHSKIPLLHVSEVTQNIRNLLEKNFLRIGVRGEISSFTSHSSGHWYFNLKDVKSQIKAVMFKSSNQQVSFKPKVGEEVTVWGKITVYEPRGDYQILCDQIEKVGDGIFQKQFEELKIKLHKEGLFNREEIIPYLPQHIAVITSVDGAALRDVLNVLNRRCKAIKVTIVPAKMEGQQCAESVIYALKQSYNLKDLDLILITRGGGSAESLSAFNDENLARFAYQSPYPLVSAIGHEIDSTIMDFIADLRAPTPSAGAELISKNAVDLQDKIKSRQKTLITYCSYYVQRLKKNLLYYQKQISSPLSQIQQSFLKRDDLINQLESYFNTFLRIKKQNIEKNHALLIQLNPLQVMNRGYSLCFKGNQVIYKAEDLQKGETVKIRFYKGEAWAQVIKKNNS